MREPSTGTRDTGRATRGFQTNERKRKKKTKLKLSARSSNDIASVCSQPLPSPPLLLANPRLAQRLLFVRLVSQGLRPLLRVPVALLPLGALEGKEATTHPAFADRLEGNAGLERRVAVDGNVTTSRGPGTAVEFALELVKQLQGAEAAEAVRGPMLA